MTRRFPSALVIAAMVAALVGCGGSGGEPGAAGTVSHHEPAQGWTADVPDGWRSVALGPTFVRGDPLVDPTRLVIRSYPGRSPAAALRAASQALDVGAGALKAGRDGGRLAWRRYRGLVRDGDLAAELAVAADGAGADVVALVARRGEIGALTRSALTPVLDSFAPGAPDPPRSVLADEPAEPSYWPTAGWRSATAASQGMDGARLEALVAEIRAARLPIDSVMVVRHGRVVLDESFGRFAAGTLPEPYAAGRLHELQSATKSVTSIVLGIALARQGEVTIATRVADLAASNWTQYVVDRPMAAAPGTAFAYDTGTSHLVSGVVSILTGRPADALATSALFRPLGITGARWLRAPEGVASGGFGLALSPDDLAKLAFLYLHHGRWDGRQVVPSDWVVRSTTDHVSVPPQEYGYLWWLDRADGYAFMAGLYGQLAVVDPADDLVAVVTAHIPADVDGSTVTRWLVEEYVLPAAR